MSIDTREKRASIAGINRLAGPSVTPNSAQDQEWRQESGYSYSGILAGAAVEPEPEAPVVTKVTGGGGGISLFPPMRRPLVLKTGARLTAITSGAASAVIVPAPVVVTETAAQLGARSGLQIRTGILRVLKLAVHLRMLRVLKLGAHLRSPTPVLRNRVQVVGRVRFGGCLAGGAWPVIEYEGEDLWLLGLTLEAGDRR